MDECKMEQLFGLVDFLRRMSVSEPDVSDSYCLAYLDGCFTAYSLCANWLEEILR